MTTQGSIFTAEYKENHSVTHFLSKSVDACMRLFQTTASATKKKSDRFAAPYLSLCQSSGMGKTATALQLRYRGYLLYYICLRSPSSSGEPGPTLPISEYLCSLSSKVHVLQFFLACFSVFRKQWLNRYGADSVDTFHQSFGEESVYDFWKEVSDQSSAAQRETPDEVTLEGKCREAVDTLLQEINSTGCAQKKGVIFVFDEARTLLEPIVPPQGSPPLNVFRLVRRALKAFSGGNLAALFMDTTSKVANFSPSEEFDPSLRVPEGGVKLFPPFTTFPTFGA